MLRQTAEISKAINPGAVSVGPAWLDCITAHQIESGELEALVGVAHMRTRNLTEHIRLATASRARACAPQQFEFQKRFGAVIPGNGQFVSDLLDVRWLKSHHRHVRAGSVKFQAPNPRETLIIKAAALLCVWGFDDWCFFGAWGLRFGAYAALFAPRSLSKNRRANANQCGAFLNCDYEIFRHPH